MTERREPVAPETGLEPTTASRLVTRSIDRTSRATFVIVSFVAMIPRHSDVEFLPYCCM